MYLYILFIHFLNSLILHHHLTVSLFFWKILVIAHTHKPYAFLWKHCLQDIMLMLYENNKIKIEIFCLSI